MPERKAVSSMIAYVLITLVATSALIITLTALAPAFDNAKSTSTLSDAFQNLNTLDDAIRTIASESEGSKRTITLSVSDGTYGINATNDWLYFEYEPDENMGLGGTKGNVRLLEGLEFADYFSSYVSGSTASPIWKNTSGQWSVSDSAYLGTNGTAYHNVSTLEKWKFSASITNVSGATGGEAFALPGNPESLVGYWTADEASGNTSYDWSCIGNNGTLTNMNTYLNGTFITGQPVDGYAGSGSGSSGGSYNTYRIASVQSYWAYSSNQYIKWNTSAVPDGSQSTTFAFTFSSQANSGGSQPVAVYVNDMATLKVNFTMPSSVTLGTAVTLYDSGGYKLVWLPTYSLSTNDRSGPMYFTVPAGILSSGQQATIMMNRTGATSKWIMINGFTDTLSYEFSIPSGWTTDCKFGTCLKFDGVNDMVTVPDSPSLDITSAGTWSVWVKSNSKLSSAAVLDKFSSGYSGYRLFYTSSGSYISAGNGTSTLMNSPTIPAALLPNGVWNHIALTKDSSGYKVYLNGALYASDSQGTSITANGKILYIGNNTYNAGSSRAFNGTIDEVMIFNRSLSADEVAALYETSAKKLSGAVGTQSITAKTPNMAVVLSNPAGSSSFDDVTVTRTSNDITMFVPYTGIDLNGTLRVGKGSQQVEITNMGANATSNRQVVQVRAA